MQLRIVGVCLLPAACLAVIASWQATPVTRAAEVQAPAASWNRVAAANYLDKREVWWQSWPSAQRDHGTICISCHTSVPYAMTRSSLRGDLHEQGATGQEKVLLQNVENRVSHWSDMVPFYSDAEEGPGKTAESHSTEAVMNAVILASYDKRSGHLRPITQTALNAAWALQQPTGEQAGGWIWQDFHLAPWESSESAYEGAAMLMLETGTAPDVFARDPENKAHLAELQTYLRQHYAAQPLLNQIYVYWASAEAPGLLDSAQRKDLLARVEHLQQPDGGWLISSLEPHERNDKTAQSTTSDGLATALIVLSMEASATTDPSFDRGLLWLRQHQEMDGRWRATSLNKDRDPQSNVGLFMSDAATGYAVLALEQADARPGRSIAARGPAEVSALVRH